MLQIFTQYFGVAGVERRSTLEFGRANSLIQDLDPTTLSFFCPLCHGKVLRAGNGPTSLPLGPLLCVFHLPSFSEPHPLHQRQSHHPPVSQLAPKTQVCVHRLLTRVWSISRECGASAESPQWSPMCRLGLRGPEVHLVGPSGALVPPQPRPCHCWGQSTRGGTESLGGKQGTCHPITSPAASRLEGSAVGTTAS